MSYRRSISTLGCPEYSLEQVLDLAKRHRLDAVEIRALSNTIDVPAVLAAAYGTPAVLAERMQSAPAPIVSLDTSLKLGANHPMGPLELADFIGLDTCLAIMNVLHEGLADTKYRPCPLLTKYVEAGWLGRKTQRGFYDYRGEVPVPTR